MEFYRKSNTLRERAKDGGYGMLTVEVLVWVSVACLVGFLATYWVMFNALQNFVNRISITPIYFLISGLVIILITLLAVSWQSWLAVRKNPVEALRYE